MTTKLDYSSDEWTLICAGPTLAGVGVTVLDPGLVSSYQETRSIVKTIAASKEHYTKNTLVQSVISEIEGHTEEDVKADRALSAEQIVQRVKLINDVLVKKAPEVEANEFKNFLYDVADHSAHAAGGFLGLGQKVSGDEANYLKTLEGLLFKPNLAPVAST